ncbi:unnamed protein product [Cuscuta campestris]|uniref:Reverse transcriptase domain-containing protein n=1 Tax=Cuscuta campestris TaxID=132261 RepID=A0A484M2B0_9ASTE|nr:unnamed protein product [Cuscuta campestris]
METRMWVIAKPSYHVRTPALMMKTRWIPQVPERAHGRGALGPTPCCGKTDFSSRTLIDSISMFVRQWLAAKIPKKLKGADAWLNEKKLLPFFPKAHKIRVVKWLAPPKGRLKLNIDASFTSGSKRGAAILRDDEGRFVRASSFSVSGSSPYQAELDTSIKGIKWALNLHHLLVYETDALEILKRIGYYTYYTHSPFPIDTLAKLIHENDVWRSHTLREDRAPPPKAGMYEVDQFTTLKASMESIVKQAIKEHLGASHPRPNLYTEPVNQAEIYGSGSHHQSDLVLSCEHCFQNHLSSACPLIEPPHPSKAKDLNLAQYANKGEGPWAQNNQEQWRERNNFPRKIIPGMTINREAESMANWAQECYENEPSEINRVNFNKAKAELLLATDYEYHFWKQKANIRWMEEGDSNSKFFHAFVKGKRSRSIIRSIEDANGTLISNLGEIKNIAIDHFTSLFSTRKQISVNSILEYMEAGIYEEDNTYLTSLPTGEEIKEIVWSLNPDSAPGPDGFNGKFFRSCWHIINKDVISATHEFFLGVPVPTSYGSTFLSLIPKINDPRQFGDYRPISLSTFMSKINTKILANRLQKLLPKVISAEQTGFQTHKGIEEQILLTEEMVHKIDSSTRGRNVVIKLDMAKAFDNMEWDFIRVMLNSMGFSLQSTQLLLANLQATHISILINGSPCGFFKMARGVKQGDPLSPLLFILASEGLSRMIMSQMESGTIANYNTGRDILVSHLAFADDIIIFSNGDGKNLRKLKKCLTIYMDA